MRTFFAALILAAAAFAQITAVDGGGAKALRVHVDDTPVLDVLASAGSAVGMKLRAEPGLLDTLTSTRVSVRRDLVALDELTLLLSGAAECTIDTVDGVIVAAASQDAASARTTTARRALDAAIRGDSTPTLRPTMTFLLGRLELADGAVDAARRTLETFASEWGDHADAPVARVLALDAAVASGDAVAMRRLLADLDAREGGLPDVPNAELVGARTCLALGDADGTVLRATTASRDSLSPRTRTLARVLLAEGWLLDGNHDRVVAELEALDRDALRAAPDVAARLPMWIGASLLASGDAHGALLQLRVAARVVRTAEDRSRTARTAAAALAALDRPMEALLWARRGLAARPSDHEGERIAVVCAELEARNGLYGEAFTTAVGVLARAGSATPEANAALSVLGKTLVALDRVDEARLALTTLSRKSAFRVDALLALGALELKSGNPTAALVALDALEGTDTVPESRRLEAAKLRGDCLMKLGHPVKAARAFEGRSENSR